MTNTQEVQLNEKGVATQTTLDAYVWTLALYERNTAYTMFSVYVLILAFELVYFYP